MRMVDDVFSNTTQSKQSVKPPQTVELLASNDKLAQTITSQDTVDLLALKSIDSGGNESIVQRLVQTAEEHNNYAGVH